VIVRHPGATPFSSFFLIALPCAEVRVQKSTDRLAETVVAILHHAL